MCSCRSICRWLPVCFVCLLIGWCYFEYTYDILIPMLDPALENTPHGSHEQGVAYMITFNIIFGIAVLAFAGAIFVDPGRIPDTWIVGNEDSESGPFFPEQTTVEIKKELTAEGRGQRRICRKSKPQVYKPDRSHYCKMLSRCVLKMDHFCPWLNNCIGFYNHKYFFLFIFYMAVLTIFMIVTMTPVFVYDVTSMDDASIDFTVRGRPARSPVLAPHASPAPHLPRVCFRCMRPPSPRRLASPASLARRTVRIHSPIPRARAPAPSRGACRRSSA